VTDVKAANSGKELGAIDGRTSLRIGSDVAQRGGETGAIAATRLLAVKLLAPPEDRGDVGLRRLGKPISRHGGSTLRRRAKVVEIGVQVLVFDFSELAAVERRDALPY
jgi:hypothetical protein